MKIGTGLKMRSDIPLTRLTRLSGSQCLPIILIHTLDELTSPSNDCNDNNNGIMLQNPIINDPLRLTLRQDNIPPSSEPNISTEDGIVRPLNKRKPQLSPIRENNSSQASNNPFLNNQIIGIGDSSVALEMLGSPSNPDPLGLQV